MAQRKYTTLPYTEYPVADGHYDTLRSPITTIILHSSASTRQGLIDTFAGGTRMVSAHYGVDNDGSLLAFLEEYYTAYHAGNLTINRQSIGIEHIDNGATVKLHTDLQYDKSIKLVADICRFYNIPADEAHIKPHSAITPTSCPNGLDVGRIINGVKALLSPQPIPLPLPPNLQQYSLNWKELAIAQGLDTNSAIFSSYRAIDAILANRVQTVTADLNKRVTELANKLSACQLANNEYKTKIINFINSL